MLSGARLAIVSAPEGSTILRPPPPGDVVADVGAAVRDALRFPIAGPSLQQMARSGGTATIVVEPPALPLPGSADDPRADAIASAIAELERAGVPLENQTILVACGLARRPGPHEIQALVRPELRRRFRGKVMVHDVESPDLVDLGEWNGTPLLVHPALVQTDLVVVVTAAETVIDGGPAAFLRASGPQVLRTAFTASSLLRARDSPAWWLALELERRIAERVPVIGASLVLDLPRIGGGVHGFPYEPESLEAIASSPLRVPFSMLPRGARRMLLMRVPRTIGTAAAFAGPPSVAQAEALVRMIARRSLTLTEPLDAIVIGIPPTTPTLPREPPNPVSAMFLGLGLALRLWRGDFPLVNGGTAILLHRLKRHFAHPTQHPYRALLSPQLSRDPYALESAERRAVLDPKAIERYRRGRTCHPLLPFAEWDACRPALDRLGSVLVAGCRDASAARMLGLVPVHGVRAAIGMAQEMAGGEARIGFLLSPPYFPLQTL
jgi:lactate racemase-like protein